jgi:hypothetical protein
VIPSEIGEMHSKEGGAAPVTGWAGLWLVPFGIVLFPAIVWFVKVQGAPSRDRVPFPNRVPSLVKEIAVAPGWQAKPGAAREDHVHQKSYSATTL